MESESQPKRMAEQNALVLHAVTGVIGRVTRYWSGQPGDQSGDLAAEVVELEQGHTLVWNAEHFIELPAPEASVFLGARAALGQLAVGFMRGAVQAGIGEATALLLLCAALREPLDTAEATRRNIAQPPAA